MLTSEQVLELLPSIERVSKFYAANGCSPDDLQQNAICKLLTREHVAKYPIVTVISTMKDYVATHGYHPNCKTLQRQSDKYILDTIKEYKDYTPDWDGIPFTNEERDVVQLYCEEGWSKDKIAKLYDTNAMWVMRTLRRAAKKAAIAWSIIDKDN